MTENTEMKAYGQEYYSVGYLDETYCVDCLSSYVDIISDNCLEILPESEWDYVPTCCVCDKEHTYMKIVGLSDGGNFRKC